MQKKKLELRQEYEMKGVQCYGEGDEGLIEFKVAVYMSVAIQFILTNAYLDAYFNSDIENIEEMFISEWDYIGAENVLMFEVISNLTDILIDDESPNLDNIIRNGVWDLIKSSIENYEEFRRCLDVMVEDAKRELLSKKSVGHVIDSLADKAMTIMSGFAELDLSEEGVKQLMDSIGSLSEELKDSPIGGLLEEAKSGKASLKNETA